LIPNDGMAVNREFHAQTFMQSASGEFVRAGVRRLDIVISGRAASSRTGNDLVMSTKSARGHAGADFGAELVDQL
jgi:hypothetical protein